MNSNTSPQIAAIRNHLSFLGVLFFTLIFLIFNSFSNKVSIEVVKQEFTKAALELIMEKDFLITKEFELDFTFYGDNEEVIRLYLSKENNGSSLTCKIENESIKKQLHDCQVDLSDFLTNTFVSLFSAFFNKEGVYIDFSESITKIQFETKGNNQYVVRLSSMTGDVKMTPFQIDSDNKKITPSFSFYVDNYFDNGDRKPIVTSAYLKDVISEYRSLNYSFTMASYFPLFSKVSEFDERAIQEGVQCGNSEISNSLKCNLTILNKLLLKYSSNKAKLLSINIEFAGYIVIVALYILMLRSILTLHVTSKRALQNVESGLPEVCLTLDSDYRWVTDLSCTFIKMGLCVSTLGVFCFFYQDFSQVMLGVFLHQKTGSLFISIVIFLVSYAVISRLLSPLIARLYKLRRKRLSESNSSLSGTRSYLFRKIMRFAQKNI